MQDLQLVTQHEDLDVLGALGGLTSRPPNQSACEERHRATRIAPADPFLGETGEPKETPAQRRCREFLCPSRGIGNVVWVSSGLLKLMARVAPGQGVATEKDVATVDELAHFVGRPLLQARVNGSITLEST